MTKKYIEFEKSSIKLTEPLKDYIEKSFEFLDSAVEKGLSTVAKFHMCKDGDEICCFIKVTYKNKFLNISSENKNDGYQAIDFLASLLKQKVRKRDNLLKDMKSQKTPLGVVFAYEMEEKEKSPIVRRKSIPYKPMLELEAIEEMKITGHPTFLFLNAEEEFENENAFKISMLYKKENGKYGVLIEDEYTKATQIDEFKTISTRKYINVDRMSEKQAIFEMEGLGHKTFMFNNKETEQTSLLYKKADGCYGIVEYNEEIEDLD